MRTHGLSLSSLKRMLVGGSACPPALMRRFEEDHGVEVIHGWGMTEMSPLGTLGRLKAKHLLLGPDDRHRLLEKQGRSIFGIDMEIVDADGQPLPWNGQAAGDLVVRGPWVIERYFGRDDCPLLNLPDGGRWFPTGDVATIDADGFMQITDRSKDVIKSGGEWISSIELENIAMAHPDVQEAAVVACRHERWDERPLLVVVKRPGTKLTRDELLDFYAGRIARWQVPDDVVFLDALPHTATGKVQKLQLRERFRNHLMPA
jgi:acyl-CoA synthetase (AMP-forming)/AMP-acid ligase II